MTQPNAQYGLTIAGGGMQTFSTAAVQLSTTSIPCQMIQISAISTNTAPIIVANSTCAFATTGRIGVACWVGSTSPPLTIYAKDVSSVYVKGLSTEACSYVYYAVSVP